MRRAEPSVAAVLDASALLAFLRDESGAEVIAHALDGRAAISAVNCAEVLSRVTEIGHDPAVLATELRSIGFVGKALLVEPLTEEDSVAIATLRPQTRTLGLSLADRACLALGRRLGARILTTDRAWADLDDVKNVEVVRS